MIPSRTLHITNGDSAAGTMREAALAGDILPWRDVLHDGPVPGGLTLSELSRVRAGFLAGRNPGELDNLLREFAERDSMLERFNEYDGVVLWFEWDLYDQLQLVQLLDFFADRSRLSNLPPLEIVSFAGYLGSIPVEMFKRLYAKREPVSEAMLSLGQRAWRAVTASEPYDVLNLLKEDTTVLPFLGGALLRFLEELPWRRDGLSRAERQLLEGMSNGPASFMDIFRQAANKEERVYCGDASAATYLERLGGGDSPLVSFHLDETPQHRTETSNPTWMFSADLALTKTGRAVLAAEQDWIQLGGSDRWLGGMHLNDGGAQWRWDAANSTVTRAAQS